MIELSEKGAYLYPVIIHQKPFFVNEKCRKRQTFVNLVLGLMAVLILVPTAWVFTAPIKGNAEFF